MRTQPPPSRLLYGALAALFALAVFNALLLLGDGGGATIGRGAMALPLFDVAAAFVAAAIGGAVARDARFRAIGLALIALSWAITLLGLHAMPPAAATEELRTLGGLLRHHGLAIVATLAVAWLGAWTGERLARRRSPFRTHAG